MSLSQLFLLLFVGLPSLTIIWIIRLILKHKGHSDKIRSFYKYAFSLLFVVIILLFVLEKASRTATTSFRLNEHIEIHIKSIARGSFLDNPTDITFTITHHASNKNLSFDYFTNDLHNFKFYLNQADSSQLFIEQQQSAVGVYWVIDLKTLQLPERKTEFLHETAYNLQEVATLNHFHKIERPQ